MKKEKKYPLFLICEAIFLLLLFIFLKIDSVVHSAPLRELKSFPAKAIGLFPYDRAIPLRYVKRRETAPRERVELRGDIRNRIFSHLFFDPVTMELFIEICWNSKTLFGGKEICRYEVDDPEVKQNLIDFIQT